MAKSLATDRRVPKLVRPLVVFGLLPVPGPFDEAVLTLALLILVVSRLGLVGTLWREASDA
jgi:hypothetical protein